jgi:hypothetical protein
LKHNAKYIFYVQGLKIMVAWSPVATNFSRSIQDLVFGVADADSMRCTHYCMLLAIVVASEFFSFGSLD